MAKERRQLRVVGEESAQALERDARLISGMLAGDADALRRLIDHYDRLVRYTVFRSASGACQRDPSFLDARASEVWTGFVESIRRQGSGPDGSLGPYLVQIARNKCNDFLRQQFREQTEDSLDDQSAAVAEDADPLAMLLDLERAEVLRSCMAKLGDEDRNLLQELELIVHRRWREASERLGLAESTLRSRWEKVLDRLKRCVEKNL